MGYRFWEEERAGTIPFFEGLKRGEALEGLLGQVLVGEAAVTVERGFQVHGVLEEDSDIRLRIPPCQGTEGRSPAITPERKASRCQRLSVPDRLSSPLDGSSCLRYS